jgi:hypothetical protein
MTFDEFFDKWRMGHWGEREKAEMMADFEKVRPITNLTQIDNGLVIEEASK